MTIAWFDFVSPTKPSWSSGFARSQGESDSPDLWPGLVGAWVPRLGHQGDKLFDVSGYGNHGTLTAMAPDSDWVATPVGLGLDFDGTGDYVTLGSTFNAKPTIGLTLYAHVFVRSVIARQALIARWGPSDAEWMLTTWEDGSFFFDVWNGADIDAWSAVGALSVNTWYQLAGTYQPSTYVRAFLNGVQVAEDVASVPATLRNVSLSTRIGMRSDSADWPANAILADVRVWNRPLSPGQIAALTADPLAMFRLRHRIWTGTLVDTLTEAIPPDAILASTNTTGAVTAIDDDPDSPDANWVTASSATAATDLRVSFASPTGTPYGSQNFRYYLRKTTGTPTPTIIAELRQNNTLRKTLHNGTGITSTSGEVLQGDWNAGDLVTVLDGSDVELRIVSSPGISQVPGAMPAYSGTGQAAAVVNATITTAITPDKPSTVNAGDLLILQVLARNDNNDGAGPVAITDWTPFAGNPYGGTNNSRQSLYWRIAGAGEASQTVSVTCTGSTTNDLAMARIYRFTAADGFDAAPIEAISTNAGTASPLTAPASVTPTTTNRRAVCMGAIASSDATIGSMTGESAGDWTEAVTGNSTTGGDGTLNVQTADASAGSAISGGSIAFTLSTSAHWNTVGFCLVPALVAGVATNTVEFGAIEWNARYLSTGAIEETLDVSGSLGAAGAIVRQPARTFAGSL